MQNILEISGSEIVRTFKSDGQRFTEFVDDLIVGLALRNGVPRSSVQTNVRTNLADGGVDTEVTVAIPNDPFGYCSGVQTIWQYKARPYADISDNDLKKEIAGKYCKKKIEDGYGYRVAISDDMPSEKQTEWRGLLTAEARKFNPQAPAALVATASQLATWASSLGGIRAKYYGAPGGGEFYPLSDWAQIQRELTRNYVDVPDWTDAANAILEHCDYGSETGHAVLCVHGTTGVGKSRFVLETLSRLDGAETLVLCAPDGLIAQRLARDLLSNDVHCILLADECLPETRFKLQERLAPCRDRVRVVAIDNSGFDSSTSPIDLSLDLMPDDTVKGILAKNFDQVPSDRRSQYAHESEGSIRVALEMCRDDPLASPDSPRVGLLKAWLKNKFSREDWDAISALSLVWRIGWRQDVRAELGQLAKLVGMEESTLRGCLRRAKTRSGFVSDSGRYMSVSTEAIARLAFESAWEHWARDDPSHFLGQIPEELVNVFLKRVQTHGGREARRDVADFFRDWVGGLGVVDLADPAVARRACLLTEAMPSALLPLLARAIATASHEELLSLGGSSTGFRSRGGRRYIVWTLERLCWFAELFPYVEDALFRLAVAENENRISNNSRALYRQIMRIFLSGTSLPFSERVAVLETRLREGGEPGQLLAIEALERATQSFGSTRRGRPATVGGRLPEDEWQPRTGAEEREAFLKCLALLGEALSFESDSVREAAAAGLAKHTRRLLYRGFLPELATLASESAGLRERTAELIGDAEAFLQYDLPDEPNEQTLAYIDSVQNWIATLSSGSLDARLKAMVGRWPGSLAAPSEGGVPSRQLADLADELSASDLQRLLPWLCSEAARSGYNFGELLGARTAMSDRIDDVMSATSAQGGTLFARGFARGAAKAGRADLVHRAISVLEEDAPSLAVDVSAAAESTSVVAERIRRLVAEGSLPSHFLAGPVISFRGQELSAEEITSLLSDLVSHLDDDATVSEAVRLAGHWLTSNDMAAFVGAQEGFTDFAFEILEAAADGDGGDAYWWGASLRKLRDQHPERVVKTASRALVANGVNHRNHAASILSSLSSSHPELVVEELGTAILDPERGWNFRVGNLKGLAASLPPELMKEWLDQNGLAAARGIARHLPPPRAVGDGQFEVHPLTEYVLTAFEDDDETFQAFVAGTHSQQMYMGDIAAQHEAEADAARPLLSHPLRRIREWAAAEIRRGEADARYWRELEEERETEF
ncbi:MAG: hypothetical protein KC619_26555 [Myxococcales bacterium]|nr:hypothetical protein [Myxococcales bacterium]